MTEKGFWPTELLHPLSVHFPVALLIFATLLMLASFVLKNEKESLRKFGSILLYTGCITAWISIYTGDLAEGAVARKICDPTVLKRHELSAYTMAYLFTAASLLNLGLLFKLMKGILINITPYFICLFMLIGSGYLVNVGHLGASLVYDQGAGVNVPPSDCSGWTDNP